MPIPAARLLRAVSGLPETEIEKIVKAVEERQRSLTSTRPAAKKLRR
jgi:hypothetical protein